MDVYMHESPTRFIFFINMLIKQVKTLQDKAWIQEITLFELNLVSAYRFKIEET